MTALISIIVPCYNQAIYLPEALDSVLAQTYSNWECIIINDGSIDHTDEIAKLYLKKDQRFRYICQENGGLSNARNVGIRNSYGEFILPLDADDLISPTYLEKALNRFTEYPETKLVYCKATLIGMINEPWDLEEFKYDRFIWRNCIFCTAMYKRSDYDKTVGYNTNMIFGNEDWDFWLSLLNKEDIVYRIDEALFSYRVKDVSMRTQLGNYHTEESLIQLYNNHTEIYDSFKERLVYYHSLYDEVSDLRATLSKIKNSHAYRLGKFLLKPISWFR